MNGGHNHDIWFWPKQPINLIIIQRLLSLSLSLSLLFFMILTYIFAYLTFFHFPLSLSLSLSFSFFSLSLSHADKQIFEFGNSISLDELSSPYRKILNVFIPTVISPLPPLHTSVNPHSTHPSLRMTVIFKWNWRLL